MKIQKSISATMKRKAREYGSQAKFAEALGIGRKSCQEYMAEWGNPSAATIQQLADRMGVTWGELVSGESDSGRAFDIISGMLDGLHPSLYAAGAALLDSMRVIFQLSDQRSADGAYWRYTVTEPRPFQYGLRAEVRVEADWKYVKESDPFTDDRMAAQAAAELFTSNALSPIHQEEVIEDYMKSI